jgi:DNA-binding LacI/PurR family transcriptional regulator
MHPVPQRTLLVVHTQEILRQGIVAGRWRERLPGERRLSEELQVSRWTLRVALAALARQRVIRIVHGRACEIVRPARAATTAKPKRRNWSVGLIMPEPLWRLRPSVTLWIDALRVRLQAMNAQLDLYDGPRYFGAGHAKALAELTSAAPHDGWCLLLSTQSMQRWFRERALPVVVTGSSFADAPLPSVDLDHRAVGRHAAAALLAKGHRRIALLASHAGFAGVMDCEAGFREALGQPQYAGAELILGHHSGTAVDVATTLDRLLRRTARPTALFVQQSNTLLATISHLAQRGLAIGRDLALVAGEEEPYFRHLLPAITHYSFSSDVYARHVGRTLQRVLDGSLVTDTRVQIMPDFVRGATLTPL